MLAPPSLPFPAVRLRSPTTTALLLSFLLSAGCLVTFSHAMLTIPSSASAVHNWEENVLKFCDAPSISNLRVKLISAKLSMHALNLHNNQRCDDLTRLAGRLAEFKDDHHLPARLRSTLTTYWQVVGANSDACNRQRQLNLSYSFVR